MAQHENDKRIDYLEFPVTDVAEAKRSYTAVFGWEFVDYGPDYTSFNDGRLAGGLRKEAKVERGGPLVVIYSGQLQSVHAAIKEAGGVIVQDTFDFPGGRRFHFTDPSGNELAVWSEQ